ncbi:MAG: hypothetical protein CVV03_04550 [Firmicutes bacterium HGW-Firmicutes-8]|nr:MAG: hypothetical protein CVV03_04550 [Firmicutes bacterium HGW-Firmicutes-8]
MKIVIAALIIFMVLVGFAAFSFYYLSNTANTLLTDVESVEKSVQAKDWQQAEKKFGELDLSWERTSGIWARLIDHQELDNINITMSRIEKFIETKNLTGFMPESAELKLLFKHIPEKEALNLENIL